MGHLIDRIRELLGPELSPLFQINEPGNSRSDFNRQLKEFFENYALQMPKPARDYIIDLLHLPPKYLPRPLLWSPPPFKDVDHYCFEARRAGTECIDFGTFRSQRLTLDLCGYIPAWAEENDLIGEGMMELISLSSPHVKVQIPVTVLGNIVGRGTAVLLTDTRQLWFYQTPDAMDGHLQGVATAALLKIPAEGISKDTAIEFEEEYDHVQVSLFDYWGDEEKEDIEVDIDVKTSIPLPFEDNMGLPMSVALFLSEFE
jgi:hypothetical protein